MIYCPYTDKDLEDSESNSEHIIPLSLGGMDSLEIPVCKVFNSKVGSDIDGKIGQELIIQSRRARLKVKGHSGKVPAMYYKNASDIDTGLPLQVRITKDEGMKLRAPYVPEGASHPKGKKIKITTSSDPDIWLKYVAKVALSAGYFSYGEYFRNNVNADELRSIMTMSHSELLEHKPEIKAHAHHIYLDDFEEIKTYKKICTTFSNYSCIGIVPSNKHLTFFTSILGQYIGMIRVEANTKEFPNEGSYSWGHFICPVNNQLGRTSYYRVIQLHDKRN